MDTAPYIEVRVAQRFSAPADRVFNAWIDPATAGKWLFATASHPMSRVTIDARAGGSFRFEDRRNGEGTVQAGQYIEIARPQRLVFTLLGLARSRDSSSVVVEIVPAGTGCELTLVHEGVLPGQLSRIEGRWAGMFYGLGALLGQNFTRAGADFR